MIGAIVALVGTSVAAYTDFKTTYIPDKLNYAMIAIGLAYVWLSFPMSDALWHTAIAALVFLIGLALYLFGQLGGGDVKLFAALALLMPIYPAALSAINPVGAIVAPYPPVVSIFFAAAVISMVFVPVNYLNKLYHDRKKLKNLRKKITRGAMYSVATLPIFYIWSVFSPRALIVALPIILGAFSLAFKEDILERYVSMKKKVKDLNEDDVLALELMDDKVVKKLGVGMRKTFFDKELKAIKARAKKHKISTVMVAEHLPTFGPFILAGLMLTLLFGDAFLWLLFF